MRVRPRADTNQSEIVEALREHGVHVVITTALGSGFPDLVCGYRGLTVLMEVKMPQSVVTAGGRGGKRLRLADEYDPQFGFSPDEIAFHAKWPGQPIVTVRRIGDALRAVGVW